MLITYNNKIIKKPLHSFYEEETFDLSKRVEEKNYVTPFKVFKNWNLIRTIAINWHKLISDYLRFCKQEQFDEN